MLNCLPDKLFKFKIMYLMYHLVIQKINNNVRDQNKKSLSNANVTFKCHYGVKIINKTLEDIKMKLLCFSLTSSCKAHGNLTNLNTSACVPI